MPEAKQEFIAKHMEVCGRARRKKSNGSGFRSPTSEKRRCARKLYEYCESLGIEPVMHHSELPEVPSE